MDAIGRAVLIAFFWPLILQLGSPDFRTRERITQLLTCRLEQAIHALKAGEKHADPEIRNRCRPLVSAWIRNHANELVEAHKPPNGWPWSDSLPPWEHEMHPEAYEYLQKSRAAGFDHSSPEYQTYREATRMWMRDRVAARLPIAELLEKLIEGHRKWVWRCLWP